MEANVSDGMEKIACKMEPTRKEDGSSFFNKCLDQALRYLGMREHNRKELQVKLSAKGFDADVIGRVLDELEDEGSLNEERYVRAFVQSRNRRHPEGRSVMLQRLMQKGADRNVAQNVLSEIYTPEYTAQLAAEVRDMILEKNADADPAQLRFLLSKAGFRLSDIAD